MDLSRREFTLAAVTSLSAMDGGALQIDSEQVTGGADFEGVAHLIGPTSARPSPGDSFFEDKVFNGYIYEDENTGARSWIRPGYDAWVQLRTALVPYEEGGLPPDPPTGQLVFDTDRGLPAWWDRDHYEWPTFTDNQDVIINTTEVAATTTRQTVYNPDINPNSLIQGRTYQVDMMGDFSTANTSSRFTIYANLAGAELAGLQNVGANVTDAPWSIEFTFTVREDGQNGSLLAHTRGLFNSEPDDTDSDPQTVDTTTATELSFDVQWNDDAADNIFRLEQGHVSQRG